MEAARVQVLRDNILAEVEVYVGIAVTHIDADVEVRSQPKEHAGIGPKPESSLVRIDRSEAIIELYRRADDGDTGPDVRQDLLPQILRTPASISNVMPVTVTFPPRKMSSSVADPRTSTAMCTGQST